MSETQWVSAMRAKGISLHTDGRSVLCHKSIFSKSPGDETESDTAFLHANWGAVICHLRSPEHAL